MSTIYDGSHFISLFWHGIYEICVISQSDSSLGFIAILDSYSIFGISKLASDPSDIGFGGHGWLVIDSYFSCYLYLKVNDFWVMHYDGYPSYYDKLCVEYDFQSLNPFHL